MCVVTVNISKKTKLVFFVYFCRRLNHMETLAVSELPSVTLSLSFSLVFYLFVLVFLPPRV